MAETVIGYLRNYSDIPIGAKQPKLVFVARKAATGGTRLFVTDPVVVPIDPSTGFFSAPLVAASSTSTETVYDVYAEWLDPNYFGEGAGLSRRDVLSGLRVPVGGGEIGELIGTPLVMGEVWISPGAAEPPGSKPGDLMFDPLTNLLYQIQ